jgi:hypothetical protein
MFPRSYLFACKRFSRTRRILLDDGIPLREGNTLSLPTAMSDRQGTHKKNMQIFISQAAACPYLEEGRFSSEGNSCSIT